jgi:hypothetical protein
VSPFSTPVLAGAALLTSPAWWRALEGTGSLSVATTRFLVAALACWLALEVLAALVGPAPAPVPVSEDHAGSRPGESDDGPAVS